MNKRPNIYIDADGCPVVDLTIKIAKKFALNVILICDTSHSIFHTDAETIVVSKGADAADFAITNRVKKGDIVITQDYGLAAMILAKQAIAMNQNGLQYTSDNIGQLLEFRHMAQKVRKSGGRIKGPKKRMKVNDEKFVKEFTKLCEIVIKEIDDNYIM
ncbi:YaiI/YqxD family protein [Bacillus andreraoultii]|uniref:YaiI/YqxD family protein n=1 Tax=Bacillus andreraoultii TaxID=1499685 RepID=UPI00053B4D1C|nr:YaiI/YqxD family protein [Bacillus andreraoultii]